MLTFTSQFLPDGCTTNFENHTASGDTAGMKCYSMHGSVEDRDIPRRPELKRSLALPHTRFISLTASPLSESEGIASGVKATFMQTGISGKTLK